MKKVYIILTHTGTILSRIIKSYTGNEFSHASISLDIGLKRMYSFGRINPYNPFWGGFIHEKTDKGTFKRFKNTITTIYSLEIDDMQYDLIEKMIKHIEQSPNKYKFNVVGLFAVGFNKRIHKEDYFYCAEFVKYMLEIAGVKTGLPEIVKPEDFKYLPKTEKIYHGLLKEYNIKEDKTIGKVKLPCDTDLHKEAI